MASFEEISAKMQAAANTAQSASNIASTLAATAGNVVGSYQQGKTMANGRAINDIEVKAEVGDGVKFIAFALIAGIIIVFLSTKKRK